MAKGPTIPMSKRIVIMMSAIVLVFVLLTGKLFHIQIVKGEEYQAKAISQQTRDITISAKRGTIYDRNYKALAISATAKSPRKRNTFMRTSCVKVVPAITAMRPGEGI